MDTSAVFFRLLSREDKAESLRESLITLSEGRQSTLTHVADPAMFRAFPGTPFVYWVSQQVRNIYREFSPLGSNDRFVKFGMGTLGDFRFLRCWWEITPSQSVTGSSESVPDSYRDQTFNGKQWVPLARL
jgi:hypothetical protein